MARLNEPIVATDSIETLRRKFLRQNRDIARVNSTQSLRIRSLENECARMLSENLDLRGQILRLETELQESRAQKIADHALEIKEKMEAQLLEWGTMLAGLGSEPVSKNRSPRASKKVKTRPSMKRNSPPHWRRRDTRDLEAAALHEGRLPPLWENRPCPRETLNREEIVALCSEAAESNNSPDLGPPPVSRFVDEEPVKIDLRIKSSSEASTTVSIEESLSRPVSKESAPKSEAKVTPMPGPTQDVMIKTSDDTSRDQPKDAPSPVEKAAPALSQPIPIIEPPTSAQISKTNLKRKAVDDEDKENARVARPGPGPEISRTTISQSEKHSIVRDRSSNRPIKEIPSARRDARGKSTVQGASVSQRKPLSAKDKNEVVNSPKKSSKAPIGDEVMKVKAEIKQDEQARDRGKPKKKEPTTVHISVPEPNPVATIASIEIESEALSAAPHLLVPDSPQPSVPDGEMRDTPPPIDISDRGETTRGSRRARTAVSYAEPNLRDKMRRPTKQLFDAVTGEGKAVRRTSNSKGNDGPSSVVKSEEKAESSKKLPEAESAKTEVAMSPLVHKVTRIPSDELPNSVVTDRKKRNSSLAAHGDDSEGAGLGSKPSLKSNRRLDDIAAREAEVAKIFDGSDVYDFPSSSPSNDPKRSNTEDDNKSNRRHKSSSRSRRLSSAVREDLAFGATDACNKDFKASGPRKRASMMASKKMVMEMENQGTDSADTNYQQC